MVCYNLLIEWHWFRSVPPAIRLNHRHYNKPICVSTAIYIIMYARHCVSEYDDTLKRSFRAICKSHQEFHTQLSGVYSSVWEGVVTTVNFISRALRQPSPYPGADEKTSNIWLTSSIDIFWNHWYKKIRIFWASCTSSVWEIYISNGKRQLQFHEIQHSWR